MQKILNFSASGIFLSALFSCSHKEINERPNVILFLADDLGYGDIGLHGNPHVKTPNIDKFANEGIEFTHFYVAPASSPTRAGILTGRYHYRTKVLDVGDEVCKMSPEEITIAEAIREGGYNTAMFGKWHLGESYPMRPSDQGFDEVLHHNFCQITDDYPVGNSYFNPWLFHNNELTKYEGYCLDVYVDEMMKYIRKCISDKKPFFIYLPSTLAHVPLQIDEKYVEPYTKMGLTNKTAKLYGMVSNIDYNFGRMLDSLKTLGIDQNTIVMFTSDNGPCSGSIEDDRYMAGLRGLKVMAYENGIRVPCLMQWPAKWKGKRKVNERAAYIDLLPTILDACGVKQPIGPVIDGVSLHPCLSGSADVIGERNLYFQLEMPAEGLPSPYENLAIFSGNYKLVQVLGETQLKTEYYNKLCKIQHREQLKPSKKLNFELFDIEKDSGEWINIAKEHPEIINRMKTQYMAWYYDVFSSRGTSRPLYKLNFQHENPAIFTTNKWLESKEWELIVETPGKYDIKVIWGNENEPSKRLSLVAAGKEFNIDVKENQHEIELNDVEIPSGYQTIQAWVNSKQNKLSTTILLTKK